MNQNDFKKVLKLTPAEVAVFKLMGAGKNTGEVAKALRLSVKTIETHAAHIREKTELAHITAVRHLATRFAIFCEQNKLKLVDAPVPSAPKLQFQPA